MAEASKAEAGTQKAQAEGNGSQTKDPTVLELLAEFKAREGSKGAADNGAASDTESKTKSRSSKDDEDEDVKYQRFRKRFAAEQAAETAARADLTDLAKSIAKETDMEDDAVQDWLTSRMMRDGEVMEVWLGRTRSHAALKRWKDLAKALTNEYVEKLDRAFSKKSSGRSDREAARASARTRTGAPAKSDTKAPFNWRKPGEYDRWKRDQGHDR